MMKHSGCTCLFLLILFGCFPDQSKLGKEVALPVTKLDSPLPFPPTFPGVIPNRGFECGTTQLLLEQLAHYDSISKAEHFPTFTVPKIRLEKMIMISSAQVSPADSVLIRGVPFNLVKDGEDTLYTGTQDTAFETPEGFKIHHRLSDIPEAFKSSMEQEPGWGYYIQLPSGWCLGFCEGPSCTDRLPSPESEIKWIFKRYPRKD
jgi:hypothetical protein